MEDLIRCTKYAFGPNRLHLCGPNAAPELLERVWTQNVDSGLTFLLRGFKTMYPYLERIARANNIKSPFDRRVVEAYWLGNELLENAGKKVFFEHLKCGLRVDKLLQPREFEILTNKLNQGAKMHHSFHVFNIWKRTGNDQSPHTLESMDKCRIDWGKVASIDGPFISVATRPLILDGRGRLALGREIVKTIARSLANDEILNIKTGDIISTHWDMPCEILSQRQANNLEKYTLQSIALANYGR